jgi:hypothetical protein
LFANSGSYIRLRRQTPPLLLNATKTGSLPHLYLPTTLLHPNSTTLSDQDASPGAPKPEAPAVEHLNIKVTDNNNEVFFKIKRSTALKKLMDAFCDRQGKQIQTVRFLFDGTRVRPEDTPDGVSSTS